jgi:hypothetical protein
MDCAAGWSASGLESRGRVTPRGSTPPLSSYKFLCYTINMKTCTKCFEDKDFSNYSPNKRTKDGYHSICKPCAAKIARDWQRDNPEQRLESQRRRNLKKHGITLEEYNQRLANQEGVCALCSGPPTGNGTAHRTLNIDHDHSCCPGSYSCGKCLRGLLCNKCNTALGLLQDSTAILARAIEYINNGTWPVGNRK